MKYFLALFFLLSGCSTMSDYRQGCLDGYMRAAEADDQSGYLKDPKHEEFVRGNVDRAVCEPLDNRRTEKKMRAYPKGR